MYITQKEVEKILDIMLEFPEANNYRLEADSSSGIGTMLTLTMSMVLNNRPVTVMVEIGDVEDW